MNRIFSYIAVALSIACPIVLFFWLLEIAPSLAPAGSRASFALYLGDFLISMSLIVILVWTVLQRVNQKRTGKCTQKVSAKVISIRKDVKSSGKGKKTTLYLPRFEYTNSQGQRQKLYGSHYESSTDRNEWYVGQKIDLLINPQNPSEFVLARDAAPASVQEKKFRLIPIFTLAAGILLYFGSLYF